MSFLIRTQSVTVNKSILQERAEKQANFSPSSVLGSKGLPIKEGAAESAPGGTGAANAGTALPLLPPAGDGANK